MKEGVNGMRDGFQTTYEELKPITAVDKVNNTFCFQTTYEELKLRKAKEGKR